MDKETGDGVDGRAEMEEQTCECASGRSSSGGYKNLLLTDSKSLPESWCVAIALIGPSAHSQGRSTEWQKVRRPPGGFIINVGEILGTRDG